MSMHQRWEAAYTVACCKGGATRLRYGSGTALSLTSGEFTSITTSSQKHTNEVKLTSEMEPTLSVLVGEAASDAESEEPPGGVVARDSYVLGVGTRSGNGRGEAAFEIRRDETSGRRSPRRGWRGRSV